MDLSHPVGSPLYFLERFEVGVVQLDAERQIVSMNSFARKVLPVAEKEPFDKMVLSFHPERSRPKVNFMLDQAAGCPVQNPPPMAMIINIPERVLMIKVTRMADRQDLLSGYILVFYDVTELVSAADPGATLNREPRRLLKIPTVSGQRIELVDVEAVQCIHSEGHYTQVLTDSGRRFCNLAIGDLELRLDPKRFVRVHRGYIVNLEAVSQIKREAGKLSLVLRNPSYVVPVSRSSQETLLNRLGLEAGASRLKDRTINSEP